MGKQKPIADRLAAINGHPIRRQIMQAVQEAHSQGRLISPVGLHKQLGIPMGQTSYHVKVLERERALTLLDEIPRRGASEHLYGVNTDLLAEITDTMALDRIAEALDSSVQSRTAFELDLIEIIKSTGRPVKA